MIMLLRRMGHIKDGNPNSIANLLRGPQQRTRQYHVGDADGQGQGADSWLSWGSSWNNDPWTTSDPWGGHSLQNASASSFGSGITPLAQGYNVLPKINNDALNPNKKLLGTNVLTYLYDKT